MSPSSVDGIERSVHKTNQWLSEVARELGSDDREEAWRVLRAYLQLLRDELTVDEAAQFAAQLPMVLRGAFYEAFDPSRQAQKLRDPGTFLETFAGRAQLEPDRAPKAVEAVTRVVRRHITAGEFEDVLAQLPAKLREVLQAA
jgi:uncharacterized protein (DUF2267 family)